MESRPKVTSIQFRTKPREERSGPLETGFRSASSRTSAEIVAMMMAGAADCPTGGVAASAMQLAASVLGGTPWTHVNGGGIGSPWRDAEKAVADVFETASVGIASGLGEMNTHLAGAILPPTGLFASHTRAFDGTAAEIARFQEEAIAAAARGIASIATIPQDVREAVMGFLPEKSREQAAFERQLAESLQREAEAAAAAAAEFAEAELLHAKRAASVARHQQSLRAAAQRHRRAPRRQTSQRRVATRSASRGDPPSPPAPNYFRTAAPTRGPPMEHHGGAALLFS